MSFTQGLREYDQNKQLRNLYERLVGDVPREGERAVYFLQGHLEQLDFSTKQELSHGIAHFNLPSQILCRVINVQLLVEPTTNEIYFRYTLLPDVESEPTVPDPTPSEIQEHGVHSFYEILIASIASTPKVSARQQSPIPSSMVSSQNMHLGVLATASHAIMTGTMFVVCCKQRASQFVIRVNKYLEAINNNIHVGIRFKMRFQTEDSLEMSLFGTIIGIGDFSPEWLESRWRSLKVHWDEPFKVPRPERVSPWEIEPALTSSVKNVSNLIIVKSNRFKPIQCVSSKMTSLSTTFGQLNSNKTSKMRVDGIWPASPLFNESSSFIFEPRKDKAGLSDSSSFPSEPKKDKASTSSLASFCNWFCCCFK